MTESESQFADGRNERNSVCLKCAIDDGLIVRWVRGVANNIISVNLTIYHPIYQSSVGLCILFN